MKRVLGLDMAYNQRKITRKLMNENEKFALRFRRSTHTDTQEEI
jgi:hypothetical protein